MFLKIISLIFILDSLLVLGMKDFSNNFKDKNTTFQKRGLFSNFLLKKVSKDQIFVEKLLTELERQVEQIQQNKLDEEEELKRNILNKYLVGSSSRRFLNDFMTLRF